MAASFPFLLFLVGKNYLKIAAFMGFEKLTGKLTFFA